jgi:hypothetical protein
MFSNSSISRNPELYMGAGRSDEGMSSLPQQIAEVRIPSKMSADGDIIYDDQRTYSVPSNINHYQRNDY